MTPPPDVNWVEYLKSLGLPSVIAVGAYYGVPKIWGALKQRIAINGQQNDLTQAGLGGVNDAVTILRTQLSDMKGDLSAMRVRVVDMEATLQKAVDDKLSAEQGEAIAKNDLFNLRLYVNRLLTQLQSAGIIPVSENSSSNKP